MNRRRRYAVSFLLVSLVTGIFLMPISGRVGYSELKRDNLSFIHTEVDILAVAASPGWNLISIPVIPSDPRVSSLFPSAISQAYSYEGGYVEKESLVVGRGYWIKFAQAETVLIAGTINHPETLALAVGWNMVGVAGDIASAVSKIIASPSGLLVSPFYWFVPGVGYKTTDTLRSGVGYWVRAGENGMLALPPPPPDGPPQLLLPADDSNGLPSTLSLIWSQVKYADSYHIQVATDSLFLSIVSEVASQDTALTLSGLQCGETYFWRGRAQNLTDTTLWSQVWEFATEGVFPLSPSLSAPSDGSDSLHPHIAFSWSGVPGASGYRLQVTTDSTFTALPIVDMFTVDTLQPACLHYSKEYYWRVSVENECKSEHIWSTPRRFSTMAIPDSAGWQKLGLPNQYISSIACQDSLTIYAATQSGMFKTTNAGGCWDTLIANLKFLDLKLHPWNRQVLYAVLGGGIDPPYGILKTTDGGANWYFSNNGITLDFEHGVKALEFDMQSPETLYCATGGNFDGAVYRSSNGGSDWVSVTTNDTLTLNPINLAVHPDTTSIVYAGTVSGGFLLRTTDYGASWKVLESFDAIQDIEIDHSDPSLIYLSAAYLDSSIRISADGGASWSNSTNGLPSQHTAWSFAVHPTSRQVYAAIATSGGNGGLFLSVDFGSSWMREHGIPAGNNITALAFCTLDGRMLTAIQGLGIRRKGTN